MNNIETTVCIIGAGPSGLLTYDYLMKYNIPTVIFESSCNYGGQCTAFYGNKPINGIPGLYNTNASEFIQNIYNQCINKDNLILNASINVLDIKDDLFYLQNNDNTYVCKYLVLATGASSMKPIIPNIKGIDNFIKDNDFIQFYCSNFEQYKSKKVVIAGGGDSAVDYAIAISNNTNNSLNNVVLLHRRNILRCDQNKLKYLNKVNLKLNQNILEIKKNLVITDKEEIQTNNIIFCYGFTYNNNFLKQLSDFGLILDNNLVKIDLVSMETSLKSCYAVGDVVKYPLKKKNIISCCFESERVVRAILNKEGLYNG
ncbi:MAG: NAD(P)/FAD-dependent oxidoreductase [Alphaproteobacteria bacterium]|nr:NAD(P)/FAD-dependent oxidoreductase [Alphaproteobacteria bacterium]